MKSLINHWRQADLRSTDRSGQLIRTTRCAGARAVRAALTERATRGRGALQATDRASIGSTE